MKKRFAALDVLRGLTVAFMCIVNNPGNWGKLYPPLRHAAWSGCTPTDLVFPFFVFCMGCAMAFSLSKYDGLNRESTWKILRRGIAIVLVGWLLAMYPFYPYSPHDPSWSFGENYLYWLQHKRLLGVLPRIGFSYILAGLVILGLRKSPLKIGISIFALMAVWTGAVVLLSDAPGPFTLEGTWVPKVDEFLFGTNHMYRAYPTADGGSRWFDPEGMWGVLTCACTALLGYLAGALVRDSRQAYAAEPAETNSPVGVVARLFFGGILALAAAMVLTIWIPLNKALWTPSYAVYAAGWAMVVLAFLSYLMDVRGYERIFTPAKAMGMNALAAFVLSGIIAKTFGWIGWSPSQYFRANEFTSLCHAVLFMLVIFGFQWFFYKKKIIIKL